MSDPRDDGWDDEPAAKVEQPARVPPPTNDRPPQGRTAEEAYQRRMSKEMGTIAEKMAEVARPKYGDLMSVYGYALYEVRTREVSWFGIKLESVSELAARRYGMEGIGREVEIRDAICVVYPKLYKPVFRKE